MHGLSFVATMGLFAPLALGAMQFQAENATMGAMNETTGAMNATTPAGCPEPGTNATEYLKLKLTGNHSWYDAATKTHYQKNDYTIQNTGAADICNISLVAPVKDNNHTFVREPYNVKVSNATEDPSFVGWYLEMPQDQKGAERLYPGAFYTFGYVLYSHVVQDLASAPAVVVSGNVCDPATNNRECGVAMNETMPMGAHNETMPGASNETMPAASNETMPAEATNTTEPMAEEVPPTATNTSEPAAEPPAAEPAAAEPAPAEEAAPAEAAPAQEQTATENTTASAEPANAAASPDGTATEQTETQPQQTGGAARLRRMLRK